MEFKAKAKFIKIAPAKLMPLADVVRGKNAQEAINWLATYAAQKSVAMKKVVESAAANARQHGNHAAVDLFVKSIWIDQGPTFRYFKPGAMGRAKAQRRKLCHINVVLEKVH